jgi:hypothetical protein
MVAIRLYTSSDKKSYMFVWVFKLDEVNDELRLELMLWKGVSCKGRWWPIMGLLIGDNLGQDRFEFRSVFLAQP